MDLIESDLMSKSECFPKLWPVFNKARFELHLLIAMFWILSLTMGVCLVGVSYAKSEVEIKQYFVGLGLQCNKENPVVTPEDMVMLHEHKIPDNLNAKCLLACVYKKAAWMDNKGTFDVAAAIAMSDKNHDDDPDKKEKSKKVLELCKKVNDEAASDENGCERAALLTRCLVENSPKMGLAVTI